MFYAVVHLMVTSLLLKFIRRSKLRKQTVCKTDYLRLLRIQYWCMYFSISTIIPNSVSSAPILWMLDIWYCGHLYFFLDSGPTHYSQFWSELRSIACPAMCPNPLNVGSTTSYSGQHWISKHLNGLGQSFFLRLVFMFLKNHSICNRIIGVIWNHISGKQWNFLSLCRGFCILV